MCLSGLYGRIQSVRDLQGSRLSLLGPSARGQPGSSGRGSHASRVARSPLVWGSRSHGSAWSNRPFPYRGKIRNSNAKFKGNQRRVRRPGYVVRHRSGTCLLAGHRPGATIRRCGRLLVQGGTCTGTHEGMHNFSAFFSYAEETRDGQNCLGGNPCERRNHSSKTCGPALNRCDGSRRPELGRTSLEAACTRPGGRRRKPSSFGGTDWKQIGQHRSLSGLDVSRSSTSSTGARTANDAAAS